MKRFAAVLVAVFGICSLAVADEPAIERAAALNGSNYAIVAPTFNSSTAASSYLRLFNGGFGAATFNVTVIGNATGNVYGTAAIQIPQFASPQYSMATLLTLANVGSPAGNDTGFTLYLQSAEPWAGYQHVTFNPTTTLFGNNSVCPKSTLNEVEGNHSIAVLTNVHTTLLPTYPSTVYIHNPNNTAVTYEVLVYDAGAANQTTGVLDATAGFYEGNFYVTIAANSTYSTTFAAIETLAMANWQPTGSQVHANIIVYDPTQTYAPPVLSQAIVNQSLGGQIDMSVGCSITPAAQVQSALTSASLTRYCVTGQGAVGATRAFLQVSSANGAVSGLVPDPPDGTANYVLGTGQVTETTFTGTVSSYDGGGTFSGTIQNGTITFTSGSHTLTGSTCY